MKHIQIITQYKMRWVDFMLETFKDWKYTAGTKPKPELKPDIMVFMWADKTARDFINNNEKNVPYIVFLRAYEYVSDYWLDIQWDKVDRVMCVNDFIAEYITEVTKKKPIVLYNGTNPKQWSFKERKHGNKIAQVSHIHYKKNHSLALQILNKLPKEYELHCAGDIQLPDVYYYLQNLSKELDRNIYCYGHIPEAQLDEWLEDKNYILSASMREGCPNNIIEAMAKGIKPIVHNWPGARNQFGEYVFNTIDEALAMMSPSSAYDSRMYREVVERKFSMDQFVKFRKVVEELV